MRILLHEDSVYRNKIVWLSLFLAIGVVFRHSVNISVYGVSRGIYYWFQIYVNACTSLIVPTFFMLSGYLFYQNFSYATLISKWKSRFFSLVIPYVCWNLIAYFYYESIVFLPFVSGSMNQSVEPLNLRWLFHNALLGGHNVTWFIGFLIIYIMVTPCFYGLLRSYKLGIPILIGVFILNTNINSALIRNGLIFLGGGGNWYVLS